MIKMIGEINYLLYQQIWLRWLER